MPTDPLNGYIEWYQNYESGIAAIVEAELRSIHIYIPLFYQKFLKWEVDAKYRIVPLDKVELKPILLDDKKQADGLDLTPNDLTVPFKASQHTKTTNSPAP
jgi:hypothetical protein